MLSDGPYWLMKGTKESPKHSCHHSKEGNKWPSPYSGSNSWKEIASHIVIVENVFGRETKLSAVLDHRFRFAETLYYRIVQTCRCQTSFHIVLHALRSEKSEGYKTWRRRRLQWDLDELWNDQGIKEAAKNVVPPHWWRRENKDAKRRW